MDHMSESEPAEPPPQPDLLIRTGDLGQVAQTLGDAVAAGVVGYLGAKLGSKPPPPPPPEPPQVVLPPGVERE
jgi:hypothetical protein